MVAVTQVETSYARWRVVSEISITKSGRYGKRKHASIKLGEAA
jgi:hypothetical protein